MGSGVVLKWCLLKDTYQEVKTLIYKFMVGAREVGSIQKVGASPFRGTLMCKREHYVSWKKVLYMQKICK